MLFQDLLNDARKRLAEIAKDPVKYSSLLEGLVLQVRPKISLCEQHKKSDFLFCFVLPSPAFFHFFRDSINCWNLKLPFAAGSRT